VNASNNATIAAVASPGAGIYLGAGLYLLTASPAQQPNARAIWTSEEATELTTSVKPEKKYGEDDYRTGWVDGVDSNSNSEDEKRNKESTRRPHAGVNGP
jgi:hypothetical protein